MSIYRKLTLKLILVGPSGVGKTSLVSAFFKQKFESQSASTVAPAFCTSSIEIDSHTTVDLQLWDTAGQEQYQSISQMFYRESHIAFVCYDQPEIQSVETWVSRVREHAPDAKIYLVTTKADLFVDREMEDLVKQEGEQLAGRIGAKHVVTSALAGRNVTELFEGAARNSVVGEGSVRQGDRIVPQRVAMEEDVCC
jgi:small GTP-binding protein